MRYLQVSLAVVFMFSAVQSFADHDGKNGPCSAYFATCKTDPTVTGAKGRKARETAMHQCMSNAATADTANGAQCTKAMQQHGDHGHKHSGDAATPSSGT